MPDKITEAFSAIKSTGLFLDEKDFKEQLSRSPKDVFSAMSSTGLFVDYDDFETSLGLKKKDAPASTQPAKTLPAGVSPDLKAGSQSLSQSQLDPFQPQLKNERLNYGDIEEVIVAAKKADDRLNNLKKMPTASAGTGGAGMVVSNRDIEIAKAERDAAMAKKNSIIKEYGKDIDKPAQLIIDQKKIDAYFDGDVFNAPKARKFVEEYTSKYGGGSYLQEMMLAKIKTRLQEEKDKPLFEGFFKKELKDRGVDQDKYGRELYSRLTAKPVADAEQIANEAKVKSEQLVGVAKSKAESAISKFTAYTEELNKQIESGVLTPDQAKLMYDTERSKTESFIKSINDRYTRGVRDININLKRKYSRIQNEVKAIENSITPEMIDASIPADIRKKIDEAGAAATNSLYRVKNEKKKAIDQSIIGAGPIANIFGKSLVSGFTRSLASFGDYMLKDGISNSFTKWLSDLSTVSEKTSSAEYDWKEPHFKLLKLVGESTGGSLPFMVPAIALSAVPGAQPLAAAAVGGLVNSMTESMTEGGQTYRESLEKGYDPVVASQRADQLYNENMKNLGAYIAGSLGDFLLVGKGGVAKKIGGTLFELSEEIPLSIRQEYERAKLDGYNKGISTFVKENPNILADTFIATIGMSSIMSGTSKAFSSITSKAPAPTSQHIQDMVSKSGAPTAKLVIEKMFENGVIDESAKNKFMADVDRISITTDKLSDVGITGDKSKLLIALADKEKELKQQVESEQDSAVKNVLQGQLKSVQEDIKGVSDDTVPFISFTLPGGNNMTRVITVNEFNALPQDQKDDAIKAADKISVIGDDTLQSQLNESKKVLGNMPMPDGAYSNELSNTESGMAVDQTGQLINKKQQIKEKFGFSDEAFTEETYTPEEDAADREALPESEFKTEEELINFLETGEYAMLTGQNPDAVPLSKEANRTLNQKATEWLAARGLKPTPLFGKYGNSERSFFVPNMTKEQSIEFAKEFQQDSVAHSSGLVYKDGSFNPRNGKPTVEQLFDKGEDFFSSINIGGKKVDFRVPYDLDTKMPAEKKKTIVDEINEEVLGKKPATIDAALSTAVDTASKSLEKAGIKFSIIDSSADQSGAARGNQAIFKSDTGEIIIDKSKLQNDIEAGLVVWHEAAHPVMNILRNTDKSLYDAVVGGLQDAAGKNRGIADALGWAQENYGGEATQNDEAIVETIGRINAGVIDIESLDTGIRQKLIDFINAIAKALGIDPILNNTDLAQFKKTVSEVADALKTGRDVAEIVGEGNVKEYMNKISDPEAVAAGSYDIQPRVSEGSIDVYQSKEVDNLPRRSLEDLYNQFEGKAVVINSDPTRVGELTLPSGKKIFMYGGPGYLSVKDNVQGNVGFATTQLGKVKSWAKYVVDVFGDKPGVTFVATQAPTSILSNSYALRYVMDAVSMLPKNVLRSSDFKTEFFGKDLVLLEAAFGEKAYKDFVSKYKKADLSDKAVIDGMISEMAYKVGDDNKPASFKARGAFVSNLLGGLAAKSSIKTVEGDAGYVSKKPQKFIAKQLMDRLGINAEKVIREIGEPSLVDLYMNEGKWGMVVSGFETDPNLSIESVQEGGVKHPLFNAKFPGKNPFILDGAYEVDKLFKPVEMTGPSGEPYTKKAAQMLAGSMYVKGMPTEVDGTFEYTKSAPAGGAIQASAGNRNLIPEAKQKKLTDDKKGNYVFFHRTAGKLNKIDPKKFGSNTATGRDERPGVGISMFYTDNRTSEPGVPSNFIYAVRVPKEKVYPINEDPLNLYDEAKAMFEKDYPGQAFDANKQVGYITKVANEKGFEMTVVDWNIKGKKAVRAQTTQAVKPELYKSEEFKDGSLREVYNPELEKLKPGIQASAGNRLAPNGKPSNLNEKQWNQVRTPEFKAWFGDWENDPENASKVVDENGEPLVVYHGTTNSFDEFKTKDLGFFFSDNPDVAGSYTQKKASGDNPNIIPAFLNIKRIESIDAKGESFGSIPVTFNTINITSRGPEYKTGRLSTTEIVRTALGIRSPRILSDVKNPDGVVIKNVKDSILGGLIPSTVYAAFNENQIKSAIGNSGAFSTTDNRIQASAGNRTAADFGESADPKTRITLEDLGVYPGMTSQELLDNLLQFGGTFDPLLKAIAKKKNLGELKIADMTEITDDPSEAAGGFLSKFVKDVDDRFKGKLYINTQSDNYDFSTKNQYYTLTHELMHWVTLDSLDTPVDSPAYDKLKSIYDVLLKNADTTPGFGTFETYGLSNFNEFMAELFISAKFRDYVKDVMGTNKDLRNIDGESKDLITLLVDYLKGLYAKIFGETGPIDENSPLIDQATRVAKDMFFGDNVQASLGKRKLEQDQDFKLAAYVMRKKSEGTPIAEIAMGIMSAIPGMTVQEVNDLVSNPEQYIRTKFKYLSPALLENLISRAGVKNIYRKPSADTDPAFDSLEVDIDNISFNEQSNIDKIKEKAKEIKTKYFDAAKGLPNWVLALRDISKGIADLEVRKAINTSKELKKVAETIGFTDWNAFTAAMKSLSQPGVMQSMSTAIEPWYANIAAERKQLQNAPAVQPAEILALPEEIRPFVFQMRGAIDSLSKELIGSGYVTPEQAMTIEENLGSYANRSYRLFNEKGYKPSPEDRIAATKYLADMYIKQLAKAKAGMLTLNQIETEAIELAKKDIETILAKNVNPYFRKGDSRDTGILKERKDIPEPIRRLMGEYTDPATVFIMTVAKQAALKSSSQYLTGLRNTGLGSIFFEKDDPSRPMSHSVEIATEGSEAKNPLGGLFTTPEIAEAINSVDPTVNDLTNAWMKVVGAVRWGKTVGSVVTQMKNFLSNIGFAVMNGLVFTGENGKALSGAAKYYKGEWKGAELDELAQKAMSLGLVNQSVGMSELRQMLGSGDIHNIAVELAVTGKSGKAKNWIGKAIGGLNKSYQLSDDFWKVYAYMNERELLSGAMFGTKYDNLSSDQQASVDIEASERVKNTWPTYDRVWEGAKYVSQRAPIFGNFVSFQAESVRVLGNTVKLAVNDMKSDNPEFQAMGYKRLAGMITYVTLRSAITYAAAHAAGLGVAGLMGMFDDDEEKVKEEGIKNALPGFMRTSDLLVIPQGEKGKFTVFDLSSLDPYGVVFKSLNAMTEGREGIVGDKMEPGIAAAMAEFMSGFLEPEMTFKTMISIANNTNEKTGGKIFMEDDSRAQAFLESAKYAADQLKPSTIGFIERLMGDNKAAEFSAAVGARPYEVDLTRSFGRIMATNGKNFEDIIREYNRVKYDDKATKEEKRAAELEAEKAMAYYAEKMNKIYNQFLSLGADPKKLEQMIMDKRPVRVTGWNKNIKKAVRTGKIESDKFLK